MVVTLVKLVILIVSVRLTHPVIVLYNIQHIFKLVALVRLATLIGPI